MTTKELIKAEIDSISDEDLDDLYTLVRSFVKPRTQSRSESFMSDLRSIQIDGTEDFAGNLDLYPSKERHEEFGDAKSSLGNQLMEIRERIVASGEPLMSWEEVERELDEHRGSKRVDESYKNHRK